MIFVKCHNHSKQWESSCDPKCLVCTWHEKQSDECGTTGWERFFSYHEGQSSEAVWLQSEVDYGVRIGKE